MVDIAEHRHVQVKAQNVIGQAALEFGIERADLAIACRSPVDLDSGPHRHRFALDALVSIGQAHEPMRDSQVATDCPVKRVNVLERVRVAVQALPLGRLAIEKRDYGE